MVALGCGGDKEDDRVDLFPTVDSSVAIDERMVTCYDWNGVRPDKEVQLARTEKRPDYCYVGDVCFYNCPAGH
jgi:hypothetical protein